MFKKETSIKIATFMLSGIALMDILRGYMHTFNIWWASAHIAHMTQTADTLMLMNIFGITNFLTGSLYLLIIWKAKELSPYVLVLVPTSYLIGIISGRTTGVFQLQTAQWNGKYMMYVYLALTFLSGLNYFIAVWREKRTH